MKETVFLSVFICTVFLTAQAAVDAGKGAKAGSQSTTKSQTKTETKMQTQTRTQEQLHTPSASDLQLKERVQQQLRSTVKNYDPNKFTIMSQNGEITLQGVVQTREEAEQMEQEVMRVRGVSRVRNNLELNTEVTQ